MWAKQGCVTASMLLRAVRGLETTYRKVLFPHP